MEPAIWTIGNSKEAKHDLEQMQDSNSEPNKTELMLCIVGGKGFYHDIEAYTTAMLQCSEYFDMQGVGSASPLLLMTIERNTRGTSCNISEERNDTYYLSRHCYTQWMGWHF